MLDISDKLPVTIITGFLGSGKTTLLNQILKNKHDLKVAVLVNEFGDINIDSQLLISIDEDMIELTNGCICCTLNDGLANAVYRVLEHQDRIDYLIVETTGIADPLPIAMTFLGTELRAFTSLDSILTVVDAESFNLENATDDIAFKQVTYGDIILINKIDLVPDAKVDAIEQSIHSIKDRARIIRSEYGKVPLPLILYVKLALEMQDAEPVYPSPLNHGYVAVSFQSQRPFSLKKFQQFLDYRLPQDVFRMKGILWFKESPDRHLFQLSGKRFHIDDSEWDRPPNNQLVCIGKRLNPIQIQHLLTNCLTR